MNNHFELRQTDEIKSNIISKYRVREGVNIGGVKIMFHVIAHSIEFYNSFQVSNC